MKITNELKLFEFINGLNYSFSIMTIPKNGFNEGTSILQEPTFSDSLTKAKNNIRYLCDSEYPLDFIIYKACEWIGKGYKCRIYNENQWSIEYFINSAEKFDKRKKV